MSSKKNKELDRIFLCQLHNYLGKNKYSERQVVFLLDQFEEPVSAE
jgi:hypothetical protein